MIVEGKVHVHYPDHVASIEAQDGHLDIHVQQIKPLVKLIQHAQHLHGDESGQGTDQETGQRITLRYRGLPVLRRADIDKLQRWIGRLLGKH